MEGGFQTLFLYFSYIFISTIGEMMTYEILPTRQEGKDKGDAAAAAGMSCGELAALCTAGWLGGVGYGLSGLWIEPACN